MGDFSAAAVKGVLADTRPLRNNDFRRLWSTNIVTVIGSQLTVVAVPAQIYDITHSSAYVGLTGIFGLVPLIVFGLWGGAVADAMDRRKLLVITTCGLIATTAGFWVQAAVGLHNVWILLALFSIQQAFFAVNQPVRSAILPALLAAEQLPAALSLNMTVMQAGSIAGPLLAGVLIPFVGYSWLYLADTAGLVLALWAVARLSRMPVAVGDRRAAMGLASVIDGLRYLRSHKVLLMSFAVDLIAMIFGMPRALFPQIADQSFGATAHDRAAAFAFLFAAIGAGAVVGGVFSGWVSRVQRQGLAVVVCIVVWGVAITGFGLVIGLSDGRALPILPIAVGLLMVGGAADMASAAFRQSMLLASASDEVRGRLQGVFLVVVAGGPRIADVAHGVVAASVGTMVATTGGGIAVVVGTVAAVLAVPAFLRYRRPGSIEASEESA